MENEGSSEGSSSAEPDCLSLKSDGSMTPPPNFNNEPVTFDPSVDHGGELEMTAEIHNCVSSNTHMEDHQPYPDHLERFDEYFQVLFGESLTGRCYWEAAWSRAAYCGEFRSTAELHKYACDLTLDPNTENTQLILSDGNRKITNMRTKQPYPDHPERFDVVPQVLCEESLTGRCYWEVEWSGCAEISVTYKGISRKGESEDCIFGLNDKSWSLLCTDDSISVWHNKNFTYIPAIRSSSKRVGVYVDVSAGTLSFYSVSDTHTLTHLHTFNTTFTEPLYAGFTVYYNSSVRLCDIKQPPVRNNRHTHTLVNLLSDININT